METFVWLEYPATGGRAQFPANAADIWRAKGWRDCEPPVDTEPHLRDTPLAEPTEPEPAPEPKPKTAGRKRGGETTTAPEE